MSAQAGWYPDPGGGQGLYRYWDGRAWSAATSANPGSPPPAQPLVGGSTYGPAGVPPGSAYANYQQQVKKRSPIGWWIGGAALLVAIIVVAAIALRSVGGGGGATGVPGGQPSQDTCPRQKTATASPAPQPNDGRVHGGPLSFPRLGPPWEAPKLEDRVPFGVDVYEQVVLDQANYKGTNSWVASVLVGELQAGDGFFTPEQGSQIVVKCIIGAFYDNNPVTSDVKVNKAATIDGHEGWIVESHLSFDIPGLITKGELLIVAIVANGATSGLYYSSIPDTTPELVQPARDALRAVRVDG